jgi:type II secretory pathway component GspD/PulD (secretin)
MSLRNWLLASLPRRGSIVGSIMILLFAWSSGSIAQSLEVIQLKYRTADEVIPILQPMLESGGALTGQDYRLFVRTSPQNLRQLREAVVQIDREPRNLLVSVREATRSEVEADQAGVNARGQARESNGNWRTQGTIGAQIGSNKSSTTGDAVSSVRLIEGGSAFIATGSSVPVVTSVFAHSGRGRVAGGAAIDYRDVTSGFSVTPRVNGARVVLEIEQQSQKLEGGAVRSQTLATQASGALGEWIELGGVSESADSRERRLASGRYSTNSDARTLWVKVEAQ